MSVVRLHIILLERRDNVLKGRSNDVPSLHLDDVSHKTQMKHPTTSQWYVTETNQWYVSTTSHYYVSTTSSVSHKPNTQITLLWYVSTTCVGVTLLRRSLRFQVTLVYRIIASPPIINFWEIFQPPLPPQFYSNRPIINFKDFTKSRNQKSQIFCME